MELELDARIGQGELLLEDGERQLDELGGHVLGHGTPIAQATGLPVRYPRTHVSLVLRVGLGRVTVQADGERWRL